MIRIFKYVFYIALCTSLLHCKAKPVIVTNLNTTPTSLLNKPNILIIHVDDLGFHDLSCNGSQIYQTPNIDRLATQSVVFNNAYANYPRCVPSRYAMMTGNYPIQNGDVPDDGFEIKNVLDANNFIKTLKASGYQTAYFGKWHLGDEKSLKNFGFDYSFAAGHSGSPISFLYPFNKIKGTGKNNKTPIPDVDAVSKEGDYLTDVMAHQVANYIKTTNKNKPFLAMFSFYAVHQPLEAKQEDITRNRKEINAFNFGNKPAYIPEGTGRTKMRQDHATYAAMVETMDENVGKLLQLLKDLKIDDNTIVILSSDHGGLSNDGTNQRQLATTNFPLRAGKGWLYDGGIKVPLMIKWNHHFKPQTNNESLVMLMDVFPTLLDITIQKSLNTNGKSFLPILENKVQWTDRTVFWHSSKARPANTGDTQSSAIRSGNFKLINWYKEGRVELYNIATDPSETNDISKINIELTNQLLNQLNKWKSTF